MKEVLHEHVLLDKGIAMSCIPMPQTHGSSKAFQGEDESNGKAFLCPSMHMTVCVENDHLAFSLSMFMA